MSMNLGEDVQKIILDFIGIIDHSKEGCHAYGRKGGVVARPLIIFSVKNI